MPVMRLAENTEVSVNSVATQTKKKEPMIDSAPTIRGSPAAMSEPNTKIMSRSMIGRAMVSASARSLEIMAFSSLVTATMPAR